VSGSCSPACPAFGPAPPLGPLQGRHSLSSVGLGRTGELYTSVLALTLVGAAAGIAALVVPTVGRGPEARPRSRRLPVALIAVALLSTAVAASLPPLLQPSAMRADTVAEFSGASAWTASPSPETSFWGSCTRGVDSGLCASGGSAQWGPGLGWVLLLAATLLLLGLLLRASRRPRIATAPASAPPPPGT
jgi:hypothetical protein